MRKGEKKCNVERHHNELKLVQQFLPLSHLKYSLRQKSEAHKFFNT